MAKDVFQLPKHDFKALSLTLTPYLQNKVWVIDDTMELPNRGTLISFDRNGVILFEWNHGNIKYHWRFVRHIFSEHFDRHLYEASLGIKSGTRMAIDALERKA